MGQECNNNIPDRPQFVWPHFSIATWMKNRSVMILINAANVSDWHSIRHKSANFSSVSPYAILLTYRTMAGFSSTPHSMIWLKKWSVIGNYLWVPMDMAH